MFWGKCRNSDACAPARGRARRRSAQPTGEVEWLIRRLGTEMRSPARGYARDRSGAETGSCRRCSPAACKASAICSCARGRPVGRSNCCGARAFPCEPLGSAFCGAPSGTRSPISSGRCAVHLWHGRQLDDRPCARRRHRGHGRGISRRVRPAPAGGRARHADRAAGGGAQHRLRALGPVRPGADCQRLDRSGLAGRLRLPADLSGHDLRRQHADRGADSDPDDLADDHRDHPRPDRGDADAVSRGRLGARRDAVGDGRRRWSCPRSAAGFSAPACWPMAGRSARPSRRRW